ncbi:MAG: 6-pyruvoyl-tetrahydropterin synthase-related protein [Acidimicrobiales bacterium]
MQSLPGAGREGTGGAGRPRRDKGASRWQRSLDPASLTTFVVVAGVTAFVIAQLQPGLVLGPNMDVGGDTAAHVVAVNYFIHNLLAHGQLSGWDPEWFGGFPLYVFYFPLPAVLVAAVSLVTSYAVAFKIVTVLGTVFLPLAAYAFGRLAGFARPIPALMSAATVPFLFNFAPSHTAVYFPWNIDGGTIASTLAGEFSFSLALTFALLFLGVFIYSLRTGRYRWLAALLFALTLLCHIIPGLFAGGAAIIITVARGERRGITTVAVVGVLGALVAAFWLLPFAAYLDYSSSMNFGRVGDVYAQLFPANGEQAVQWIAAAGLAVAVWRRDRIALALSAAAGASVAAFCWLPSGLVYNGRWLPFWYLATALLAAYAIGELGRTAFAALGQEWLNPVFTGFLGGAVSVALIAAWLGVLPFYPAGGSVNPVDSWATWNYSGYQTKPGWPEFRRVIAMLEREAKAHGCGRLDYEYSPNTTDAFGSTDAPMSLPLWTNGCIDSAEGLYYESSTSNDFHFLDQAELSLQASNPVVGLPYRSLDVADGIRHLQLTGVKYFLADSPTVEADAARDRALVAVASTPESPDVVDGNTTEVSSHPRWVLYLIRDSALVVPLHYEPIVEAGLTKTQWQVTTAIAWYQDPQYWPVPIVSGGPASWPRAAAGTLLLPAASRRVPATTVSHIVYTDSTVSFRVGRLGVPVLVKVPYFPNWTATGASGPYEATPNLMVVVPHAHQVVLHYGTTLVDWTGWVASALGVVGLATLDRFGPGTGTTTPEPGPPAAPAGGADPAGSRAVDAADADEASFEW